MAVTTYGSYESKLEDIASLIEKVADRATPFMKMFLDASNVATNVKVEWVDEALKGFKDMLKANLASTTTTIVTLSGGTNAPKRIIDGVTRLLVGEEVMLVSSTITVITNEHRVCVARAQNSTTPATYSATTQVMIIGNPQSEGFDADRDDSTKGVRYFNYSQIFNRQLKLTGTAQSGNTVEKESTMNKQAAKLLPELLKEVEVALINNPVRAADANTLDNRMSGGFRYWAVSGGGNNEDMGGATVDASLIDDIIEQYLDNGADANQMAMMVSIRQQRRINDLKDAKVMGNVSQSEMALNRFVNRYDFGGKAQVDIMATTDLRDDELYFFQKDKVKVRPYKDRGFKREKLGKTGDNDRELLVGEYVFEFHNVRETLFRKYNLATA